MRELTGGVYFGEPKEIRDLGNGQKRAIDTQVYDTYEIERIAAVAFELARVRDNRVCSMEKRNVMRSGVLWHEVVDRGPQGPLRRRRARPHAGRRGRDAARPRAQAVRRDRHRQPLRRHALGRGGDAHGLARDAALGLAGRPRPADRPPPALYEPVHGSAPDIAGQGKANPIACILSFAMALRYSFEAGEAADRLEAAVEQVLAEGVRTADLIGPEGGAAVGTSAMGDAIVAALEGHAR